MKPTEVNLKIEKTQCGGFVFRFSGEAPFYAEDYEDLIHQISDEASGRLMPTDSDDDGDDREFTDEDFEFEDVEPIRGIVTAGDVEIEEGDLTDFGKTITELKGIYAMRDPRPVGNARGSAVELGLQLQSEKIEAIINLTDLDYTEEQKADLLSFGVGVHHFPVQDFDVPKVEYVNEIVKLTRDRNLKFVIHCTAGKGRTGTVVGCIFVARSSAVAADAAIEMIRKARPGSVETRQQEKFVSEYAGYVDDLRGPVTGPKYEKT